MIDQIVRDYKINQFYSPSEIRKKLNYFKNLSKKGFHNLSKDKIEDIKSELIKFVNIKMTFWADSYPTKLFRVTNNKYLYEGEKVRLQKVKDLLGPPESMTNYNRCNLPNESVFYCALNFNTAIWETKPIVGDLITVSEWEIKKGEKLNVQSIFHPRLTNLSEESQGSYDAWINHQKKVDPILSEIFEDLMLFFTEEFMKVVEESEKENYLYSSIFSSRLLQEKTNSNGFKIEAIAYPSVKMQLGATNLAICNDLVIEKLQLNSIRVYEILETNYDENDVWRKDIIKVSPSIIKTSNFDYVNIVLVR